MDAVARDVSLKSNRRLINNLPPPKFKISKCKAAGYFFLLTGYLHFDSCVIGCILNILTDEKCPFLTPIHSNLIAIALLNLDACVPTALPNELQAPRGHLTQISSVQLT